MMRSGFALCLVSLLIATACASEPPATDPLERGEQLYRQKDCQSCHLVEGRGGSLGPELTHIGTVAGSRAEGVSAGEYIRESLVTPGAYVVPGYNDVMPRGLVSDLSQADLDALVLYLSSLR